MSIKNALGILLSLFVILLFSMYALSTKMFKPEYNNIISIIMVGSFAFIPGWMLLGAFVVKLPESK